MTIKRGQTLNVNIDFDIILLQSFGMPRKQRIEYAGAWYHIISRGNYRKDLFTDGKSGEAFESALFEAVQRCGWRLYAYVIMSNHYHLALETPEPNLVAGMKWLQGTYATRFNRFHGEFGHVFQGRYKAILLNEDRSMLGLCNYIHLNPVRALLCDLDTLSKYRLSSYSRYRMGRLVEGLDRAGLLALAGLSDTPAGLHAYDQLLAMAYEENKDRWQELRKEFCRGWFAGSLDARKALSKELAKSSPDINWSGADAKDLNEQRWERIVESELKRLRRKEADILSDRKGAPWKVEIARRLRNETTATNPWIAERLHMGHPNRVSMSLSAARC
jgi:putative transposase